MLERRRKACGSFVAAIALLAVPAIHGFRTWSCQDSKCVKGYTHDPSEVVTIRECKMRCLPYAGLWPYPTGDKTISDKLIFIDPSSLTFGRHELPTEAASLVESAQNRFLDCIHRKSDGEEQDRKSGSGMAYRMAVNLEIYDPSVTQFKTFDDESYELRIETHQSQDIVEIQVKSQTFFGLRHGLETLSQLIMYDDVHKAYKMVRNAEITDRPYFTHRGIVLDTARSYINVKTMETILDAMAMNKMNTFHWHIVDSHSFPYVSAAYPELSEHGAYSRHEVYTEEDIRNLVEYARQRGIRIIPELDGPAHVGEGWNALDENLATCFNWEPWLEYCVEPPCGQLDPTNDKVYEVLDALYKEFSSLFPSDLFHMGGDEVNMNCWRSTPRIVSWMTEKGYSLSDEDLHKLWLLYQKKTHEKLRKTRNDPPPKPILWTSSLTEIEGIEKHLSPEDYIIQIWTKKTDNIIENLFRKKYKLIFSNYDELYLDCGGPHWLRDKGENWCSPYINWHTVYNHSPLSILHLTEDVNDTIYEQVLGSESAIWTEQIDESTVLPRLWPRAAALAERLWSNPSDDSGAALPRMLHHRQRMSEHGVPAELLQPQWCLQNDGHCTL